MHPFMPVRIFSLILPIHELTIQYYSERVEIEKYLVQLCIRCLGKTSVKFGVLIVSSHLLSIHSNFLYCAN
jgi:acyl-CoA thioesterase FadM